MKCPSCSKEISEQSKKCEFCGCNISRYTKEVQKGVVQVTDKDIEKAYGQTDIAHKKAEKLSARGGPFAVLFRRIELLISMLRDFKRKDYKEVPWSIIAAIVFAILYFVNPFDLIMDFIPGIGYLDDVAVVGLIFASIEHELKKYAKWKGIDLE